MAADEARRIAKRQEQETAKAQPQTTPQSTTQAILQRPSLTRPNSVLGNIFQGFVRAASATPSASPSMSSSPAQAKTPTGGNGNGASGVNAASLSAEIEKLKAERMRDVDIVCCALPPYLLVFILTILS